VNKELEGHENPSLDESGKPPDVPNIQGAALQMNDNTAGGNKRASPQPPDTVETNANKDRGKALQVNENSAGE
jgi:hypothetical protein